MIVLYVIIVTKLFGTDLRNISGRQTTNLVVKLVTLLTYVYMH